MEARRERQQEGTEAAKQQKRPHKSVASPQYGKIKKSIGSLLWTSDCDMAPGTLPVILGIELRTSRCDMAPGTLPATLGIEAEDFKWFN